MSVFECVNVCTVVRVSPLANHFYYRVFILLCSVHILECIAILTHTIEMLYNNELYKYFIFSYFCFGTNLGLLQRSDHQQHDRQRRGVHPSPLHSGPLSNLILTWNHVSLRKMGNFRFGQCTHEFS